MYGKMKIKQQKNAHDEMSSWLINSNEEGHILFKAAENKTYSEMEGF